MFAKTKGYKDWYRDREIRTQTARGIHRETKTEAARQRVSEANAERQKQRVD